MYKFLPRTSKKLQVYTEHSRSGFTLVELLVVISILAILAVIGMTVFNNTQRSARDSKRKGDIQAISAAVESRYVNGTGYTTPLAAGWFASGTIPLDPSGAGYIWQTALTSTGYSVCADLEETGQPNYCMSNQQQ